MVLAPVPARFQSLPSLPTIKLRPSRPLWVSPTNSPVRLGVSPAAAASTPTGVFNQRFEALFPRAGALGCTVCFAPPPFLPVYLCTNVGLRSLLAVVLPAPFIHSTICHVSGSGCIAGALSALAACLRPSYRSA